MNITELIELYFHEKLNEDQFHKLAEWLKEDKNHIRILIREAHLNNILTDFLAKDSEKIITEKKALETPEEKKNPFELSFDELKQAAGGKDLSPPKE